MKYRILQQRNSVTSRGGFSLLELLTVLLIIGILMGILIAVLPAVIRKGHRTNSQALVNALAQGLKAYRLEYKKWPPCITDLSRDANGDFALIVTPGVSLADPTWTELLITLTAREQSAAETTIVNRNNPQRRDFLNPEPSNTDAPEAPLTATTLHDHWQRQLCLVVDGNGDGVVHGLPDRVNNAPDGFSTYTDIAVWSWGETPVKVTTELLSTWK